MLSSLKFRTYLLLSFFCIILASCVWNQKESGTPKIESMSIERLVVGEEARFDLEWLTFKVGRSVSRVEEITRIQGREVYHISVKNRSNAFLDLIFKVEDEYHIYLDVNDFKILRFEKSVREGGYRAEEEIDFDHKKGEALYHSFTNGSRKTFRFQPGAVDIIGAIYKFRTLDWTGANEAKIPVTWDEKNYDLRVLFYKEDFIKKTPLGPVESFIINLHVHNTSKKEVNASRLRIWVSRDHGRIPLKMRAKVPIAGSVYAVLREFTVPQ